MKCTEKACPENAVHLPVPRDLLTGICEGHLAQKKAELEARAVAMKAYEERLAGGPVAVEAVDAAPERITVVSASADADEKLSEMLSEED